jgi:uncharacterized protein YdcH (DUF465 family)
MGYVISNPFVIMLGENHSLDHDFPELTFVIQDLNAHDELFAKDVKRYNELDKEIRKLELRDSPISDENMHKLKQDSAFLKDALYQKLTDAAA